MSWAVGKPTLQTNQQDWSCAGDASPARKGFWVIGAACGASAAITINCQVQVTYYCKFYDMH